MSPQSRVLQLLIVTPLFLKTLANPAPAPAPQVTSSTTADAASALPTILGDWPSLQDIEKKLGLSDSNFTNTPTFALLFPSYSNFTGDSWNVRFHGLAYKLPNVSTSDLDSIINGLNTTNLTATQQALLQNRTQDLAALPVPLAEFTAVVISDGTTITNLSGIALDAADGFGGIDQFVQVPGLGGDISQATVIETSILDIGGPGNGTSILVPTQGITIVSDIDDVLRIAKFYVPNQGLFNTLVQPYANVPEIAELFNIWAKSSQGIAFHYDTTTPVELTRTYVEYLFNNFPVGSLEMRPINISDPGQILEARINSLVKLYETFPQRQFVLIGDTSSSILLDAYPKLAFQFPNQTTCIFIRNTSATDPDDVIPYDTTGFQNLSTTQYFFYRTANDLRNLNIGSGQCVNDTVPQNVTFGQQGGVLKSNTGTHIHSCWHCLVLLGWVLTVAVGLVGL